MTTKTIAVTGANGYIASEIVKQLLAQGYKVHGTVRSVNDEKKVKHLKTLPGADKNLVLFEADLLHPETLASAIAGTDAVFHTASPVFWSKDPTRYEKELIEPAVTGTENLLKVVQNDPGKTIKTLVITGSVVSIFYNGKQGHVNTEADWSNETYLRSNSLYYHLSKTLAEKAVWKWVDNNPNSGLRLVVINPSLVHGPLLQPEVNTSVDFLYNYLTGKSKEIQQGYMPFVDVRDVAALHIRALEDETANGRYLASALSRTWENVIKDLRKIRPNAPLPTKLAEQPGAPELLFSNAKARGLLGRDFIPWEQTLKDTVESLEAPHFATNVTRRNV